MMKVKVHIKNQSQNKSKINKSRKTNNITNKTLKVNLKL